MDTEEVEIARIFKKNGSIHIDFNRDTQQFELFGYLKAFVERMEMDLVDNFEGKED